MIRKIIGLLLCVVIFPLALTVSAQSQSQPSNKPTAETQVPFVSALPFLPSTYMENGQLSLINYVRESDAMGRIQDVWTFDNAGYKDVKQTTTFLDGLSRPLQTVRRQITSGNDPVDLVSPIVYDELGRQIYKYFPYAATDANRSDGGFKSNAFYDQKKFYQDVYPTEQPAYTGEKFYYSRIDYEVSTLNRVHSTLAPGNSWVGSGNGIVQQYFVNSGNDNVVIWSITADPLTFTDNDITTNIPVANGYYPAGMLYKDVITDAEGNSTVEYKDKDGLLLLKKVQSSAVASDFSDYNGWLSTYYVYDKFKNLRFVIPPKGVSVLNGSWNLSTNQTIVDQLCFRYEYDTRNRMNAKKAPGAGWVFMVYDQRDRLVYTQDANMRRGNQWLTVLYDGLNRSVATGMTTYTGTRDELQAYVNSNTGSSSAQPMTVNGSTPASISRQLVLNTSDNGLRQAVNEITLDDGFQTPEIVDFTAEIVSANDVSNPFASSVSVTDNPIPNSSFIGLTMTFYDDYSNLEDQQYSVSTIGLLDAGTNGHAETVPAFADQKKVQNIGQVTGTKVRILEDPSNLSIGKWLTTVNFYDDRMRLIQKQGVNLRGGKDIQTNLYNFTGQLICSYTDHTNPLVSSNINIRIKTVYNYDHADRLLETYKTINDDDAAKRLISRNEYDQMGKLKRKSLGQISDQSFLEIQDLSYNIRGWLKGLNKDYSNNDNSRGVNDRWFGIDLSYDWGYDHIQRNGNIAGIKWRSKGDGVQRSYGFGYDPLSRLMYGDFNQYSSNSWNRESGIDFSMMMGDDGIDPSKAYDENGNIKAMQQNGWQLGGSHPIDQLKYTYSINSNRLKNVIDHQDESLTPTGDFRTSTLSPWHDNKTDAAVDYAYDDNGNMTRDLNKDIINGSDDGIIYNHLNLPWRIKFRSASGSKGTITYRYDANGNKLDKSTIDNAGNLESNTAYIGSFQYQTDRTLDATAGSSADVLQFVGHEEGRVRILSGSGTSVAQSFVYDYFIKDHLNNIRMVLTEEKKTDQYPMATMEPANIESENLYYSNLPESQQNLPPDYPTDNTTGPNQKAARLNGNASGQKIGPGITLKVMAGDQFSIRVSSWYNLHGIASQDLFNPLTDIVTSLIGGVSGISGGGHPSSAVLQANNATLSDNVNKYLQYKGVLAQQGRPNAFVNWVLFDNQFNYVQEGSGFEQVGQEGEFKLHSRLNLPVTKSGYLYIYLSNETKDVDVYFDNLQVSHVRGPLLEEGHYYPFGLTMAAISDKAARSDYSGNKFQYSGKEKQSKEFSDGSGLEQYDFGARFLDPQLGVWHNIDPHSDSYSSFTPYSYVLDNPINAVDPNGMDTYLSGEAAQDAFRMFMNMRPHTIDTYDRLAQLIKNDHGGESDDNFTIKAVLPVYESITPATYRHIHDAQIEGYPFILTRGEPKETGARRDDAMEDRPYYKKPIVDQPIKKPSNLPWLDEYPFASTIEGGYGASLRYVPEWEQRIQLKQLSSLYSYIQPGDKFFVLTISSNNYPYTDAPAWQWFPSGEWSHYRIERPYNLFPAPIPKEKPAFQWSPRIIPILLEGLEKLVVPL